MNTNRRNFLKMAGTSAVMGCVGKTSRNDTGTMSITDSGDPSQASNTQDGEAQTDTGETGDTGLSVDEEEDSPLADPGYGLPDRVPTSIGTSSLGDDDLRLSVVSGTMPTDLEGHIWMVHPIPPGDNAALFAGTGRIVRLDLGPEGIDAKLRLVRTPCYYADIASEGKLYAFNTMSLVRLSFMLGGRNMANTAFVVMEDDRVLVTYDGGRPNEIDPATAEFATAVGTNKEWEGLMPNWIGWLMAHPFKTIMSTAHPVVEDNTLFTVEFNTEIIGNATWTRICRWDGSGALESWKLVDPFGQDVGIEQSVHQIAVSEDFIVIVDTAFKIEIEDMFGGAAIEKQSPDAVMWVLKRSDLSSSRGAITARRIQVPIEITHVYCDRANPDGIITLHVAHTPALDVSEFIEPGNQTTSRGMVRNDLIGLLTAPTDLGALGKIRIDGNSGSLIERRVVHDERLWGGPGLCTHPPPDESGKISAMYWLNLGLAQELRLKRLEDLYADHPYRHIPMDELPEENMPQTLIRVDPEGPTIMDDWAFPPGRFGLSPQWVPGGENGYIICSMLSDDSNTPGSSGCEIWIFDAGNLAQGPLTRLSHPDFNVAFTLHSAWTRTAAPRTAAYTVDVREDLADVVSGLSIEIQTMFENSIYPHFE